MYLQRGEQSSVLGLCLLFVYLFPLILFKKNMLAGWFIYFPKSQFLGVFITWSTFLIFNWLFSAYMFTVPILGFSLSGYLYPMSLCCEFSWVLLSVPIVGSQMRYFYCHHLLQFYFWYSLWYVSSVRGV